MDEKTLNDLLECSVCLERLDTSSKVLPCQHTFCRKCLEVIVQSHQELRCPECRVLIECKIEDLPPNVLLMRILGGMKTASQPNQSVAASVVQHNSNLLVNHHNKQLPKNVATLNTGNFNQLAKNTSKQKVVVASANNHLIRGNLKYHMLNSVPHAKALYDFVSKEPGDLHFKNGEIIILRKILDHNWCIGELNGREGAFPLNHVDIIIPLPIPQCRALYDFRMGPNEEEGCLTFTRGSVIQVMRRVDANWAEGRLGDTIGIFPIAFVEMNSTARQLMDASAKHVQHNNSRVVPPKPFDNSSSDSSSTTTSTSPNSSSASNTSSNSSTAPSSPTSNLNTNSQSQQQPHQPVPQQQPQQMVQIRDNKEKRHSLTSIITHNPGERSSSNRHSVEILSPSEEEKSNQSAPQTQPTPQTPIQPKIETSGVSKPNTSHQQRIKLVTQRFNSQKFPIICEAIYSYKPMNPDELELKKGSIYYVTEKCEDGWLKGSSRSKKVGVFPGNYVVPVGRSRENHAPHHNHHPIPQIQQNTGPSSIPGLHSHPNIDRIPPELPPRNNSSSHVSPQSVWTKPLGHVDALFNRKATQTSNNQQIKNEKTNPNNSSQKEENVPLISKQVPAAVSSSTKDGKEKKEAGSAIASTTSSAVSLMKRLTNIKRSKSPTNLTSYSMDNPVFEGNPSTSSNLMHSIKVAHPVHVRSGSCPSQLLQSLPVDLGANAAESSGFLFGSKRIKNHGKERPSLHELRSNTESSVTKLKTKTESAVGSSSVMTSTQHGPSSSGTTAFKFPGVAYHRKSQSLDAGTIASQINGTPSKLKSNSHIRERFRCIVPYPPNSEYELELHVGDIVCVHKKRDNGWYKGTHQRTGKTGLFPASFVEPDI